jgi:hypothetical protein
MGPDAANGRRVTVADSNDRTNNTRTDDLTGTMFALHDRLTDIESTVESYQEHRDRDVASISAAVIELRRIVLLFGLVSFVALIVSLVIAIHVVTTLG